jgi:16S rRNA (guanine527-N7)-methyltransferase
MSTADPMDLLARGLEALEVPEPARVLQGLRVYLGELERWNPRFGLVKYETMKDLVVKHVLDSLVAWRTIRDAAGEAAVEGAKGAVLDVGSGAGFPGIPLALALPELSFTLLERSARRASFLRTCALLLGLARVEVSARDLAACEGGFDVVTFRAVAPLDRFLAELRRSGVRWRFIAAYKGRHAKAREEIESLDRTAFGLRSAELRLLEVPFFDEERCLVLLRAGQHTGPLLTNR